MRLTTREMLRRLGAAETIDAVCHVAGISREDFNSWWKSEVTVRVPDMTGPRRVGVTGLVEIERDEWGIPHIFAGTDDDLFFGFGYAMAQDRLFQLDYLRRRATGRLSEVLGPEGLESDTLVRTVGIHRMAAAEEATLPAETRKLLNAFSSGVNAVIEESCDLPPIEFDLLDYRPDPWSSTDCLCIQAEFGWYLTGRFPVIVIPELAKRVLGNGSLYEAFLQGEADEEAILPIGSYASGRMHPTKVGATVGDPNEGQGSNNWVISGMRSMTGLPMLASDPHIAFASVSCWYEVHLQGRSFNVAGMTYVGIPAIIFGRNEHVAWGITNNICSLRDLYQEKINPDLPGHFLYDGEWEPAKEIIEEIRIRGEETIRKRICFSRNGPIVDDVLPAAARNSDPVSLKWLGAFASGWLPAMQRMNSADSADEFKNALKGWQFPTWSAVFADVNDHIGYQSIGQIPVRNVWERGYRPGWDPEHQWAGLIPFEGMPNLVDPDRGWIATANNRPAGDDYPYPLSGTWSSGHRARRIRQMIEEKEKLSRQDFVRMQQDVLSLRAMKCVPKLLEALDGDSNDRRRQAIEHLRMWDCRMETDRVGASIFEGFFTQWSQGIANERFTGEVAALVSGAIGGLASELLAKDSLGWFQKVSRPLAILRAWDAALDDLSRRLGPDMSRWSWGNLHKINLKHILSGRGELSLLLDRGGVPVRGNGVTVCNTGHDPNWGASIGANYRMIVDFNETPAGLWAVDAAGESGHPGSPHYCDQLKEWLDAKYHYLPLDRRRVSGMSRTKLRLRPKA